MRVLICGDPDWTDTSAIQREVNRLPPGTTVIVEDLAGASAIATRATLARGLEVSNAGHVDAMLVFSQRPSGANLHVIAALRAIGIPVTVFDR